MDNLRAAVDRALALTADTWLVTIDAADLVDAARLAVYAAFAATGDAPRRVVADLVRLPLVEGIADHVVVRIDAAATPAARLREIWRILAPAGHIIVVVPLPISHSIWSVVSRAVIRRRVAGWLDAAMFDAGPSTTAMGALVVRAGKRDGLTPPLRVTATVHAPAIA